MLLDIVILPSTKERRRLGLFAQQLSKRYKARYIVDNKNLIPHISLYHFRTSTTKLKIIEKAVKKAIGSKKHLSIEGKLIHKGRYSIELILRKTEALRLLNKSILRYCALFRTGVMPNTFEQKMTKQVKKAIRDYGTVGTVINFEPHVTLLADFKDKQVETRKGIIGTYRVKFIAKEVAIAEVNSWYQVTRIIKRLRI